MKLFLVLLITVALSVPSVVAGEICPIAFADFLERFERNRLWQEKYIVYPLEHSWVDVDANPEWETVYTTLSKLEVAGRKHPIYPSPQARKSIPLIMEVTIASVGKRNVRLFKPDTGFLLKYSFQQVDGCWYLVKYEDWAV
ncbi:hypothetical protein [Pontibacterium sp.]|uniref:hypothetical protein n=1 Tax=Pontibacterium sp. TaxID=2036026 RepID=UPI003513C767